VKRKHTEIVENSPALQLMKAESSKNLLEEIYYGVAENSVHQSSYWPASYRAPYNSDDLYDKTNDY